MVKFLPGYNVKQRTGNTATVLVPGRLDGVYRHLLPTLRTTNMFHYNFFPKKSLRFSGFYS